LLQRLRRDVVLLHMPHVNKAHASHTLAVIFPPALTQHAAHLPLAGRPVLLLVEGSKFDKEKRPNFIFRNRS
jgi:hypothetical protein